MTPSLLAHRVTGKPDGPPLLLLNGGMMTMAAWERIAAPLADTYRIVRCDLRGQLLSPGEPEPCVEAHVADVIALLDLLGIERIQAAGTSYGAFVALRFASLYPERAASVIAITTGELITPKFWEATALVREAAIAAAAGGDGGRVLDLILPATYSPEYLESNAALLAAHRHQTSLLPTVWFLGLARILSSL